MATLLDARDQPSTCQVPPVCELLLSLHTMSGSFVHPRGQAVQSGGGQWPGAWEVRPCGHPLPPELTHAELSCL